MEQYKANKHSYSIPSVEVVATYDDVIRTSGAGATDAENYGIEHDDRWGDAW